MSKVGRNVQISISYLLCSGDRIRLRRDSGSEPRGDESIILAAGLV